MMAVPFTFRSSTPHVPGEGRSSFATLHRGGGGGQTYRGHTPLGAYKLEQDACSVLGQNISTSSSSFSSANGPDVGLWFREL